MNLLSKTEKETLKKGLKLRFITVVLFLTASAFIFGFIMLLPAYFLTPGHLFRDMPENHISVTSTSSDSIQLVLNLPAEIDSKMKILQATSKNTPVTDSLSGIINYLPKEVVLNSVIFSRNQNYKEKNGTLIFISGTALSRDSLVSFGTLLKESALFTSVDMPVSNLTKNKNLPFSMNIFIEN